MVSSLSLRVPAHAPGLIYYPEFWYSAEHQLARDDFTFDYANAAVSRHCRNFRLLSLVSPALYIPRTHVLTQFHGIAAEICEATLNSAEYEYFRAIRFIFSSHFPGLDAKADVERVIDRISSSRWLHRGRLRQVGRAVQSTPSLAVNSLAESRSNVGTFGGAVPILSRFDKSVAGVYSELIRRSTTTGVPFFHEKFLSLLSDEIQNDFYKTEIWRQTNSIYLLTGLPGFDYAIAYYNSRYESPHFRFIDNFDRLFYSPDAVREFFSVFLSPEELSDLLHTSDLSVFGAVRDARYGAPFRQFREEYFNMCRRLSKLTWLLHISGQPTDISYFAKLFVGYLSGSFDSLSDMHNMSSIAEIGASAVGESSSAAALALQVLRLLNRPASRLIRETIWRMRYGDLCSFVDAVTAYLKNKRTEYDRI